MRMWELSVRDIILSLIRRPITCVKRIDSWMTPAFAARMLGSFSARLSRRSEGLLPSWSRLMGVRSTVRKPVAMAWHIWLFRFLLAWNVILLTVLMIMVMG